MSAVPTLQYADLPARWGVSVERTPSAFRIAIEPSGWRSIMVGHIVALSILLFFTIAPIMVSLQRGNFEWPGPISSAALYLLPTLIVATFLWRRFRQRILFVVTADAFTIATMGSSPGGHVTSLPRKEVGYVRFNPYSGRLTVQHVGKDLLEFFVSPNREVVEYVASQISDALADPPMERAAPSAPSPPAHLSCWRRPTAIVASLVMLLVAIVLLLFVDVIVAKPIGFYLLLLSAIPVGIAFGTQPKKFWV